MKAKARFRRDRDLNGKGKLEVFEPISPEAHHVGLPPPIKQKSPSAKRCAFGPGFPLYQGQQRSLQVRLIRRCIAYHPLGPFAIKINEVKTLFSRSGCRCPMLAVQPVPGAIMIPGIFVRRRRNRPLSERLCDDTAQAQTAMGTMSAKRGWMLDWLFMGNLLPSDLGTGAFCGYQRRPGGGGVAPPACHSMKIGFKIETSARPRP